MNTPTLWHYTCEHSAAKLGASGLLVPALELVPFERRDRLPWWGDLVWLTDLAVPIRDALGLSSLGLVCDRIEHRYRVTDAETCRWWIEARKVMPSEWRVPLEQAPGARPRHWWVSAMWVPVELDDAL